eukprot:gene37027-48339_t
MSFASYPNASDEFVYSKVFTLGPLDDFPLCYVPDFNLNDQDQVVWEHVIFSRNEAGEWEMTARVPCPMGLFFPLGGSLLSEVAVGRLTGGVGDWGHIVPVELPGLAISVGVFLDTNPCLSCRVCLHDGLLPSSVVDSHTVLGSYLVKSTPTRAANVEIAHRAESRFRNGRSRFTGHSAGYYFRPLRDIIAGESFVVDWELFVRANAWGDRLSPSTSALTGLL